MLNTIDDLLSLASELQVEIEAQEDVSCLAKPVQVGNYLIPNSLTIHPMEGCDGDSEGRPGKLTIRRYERFAGGGAGLLWFEATAVVPEGRGNPRQLWLHKDNKDSFAALVKHIHKSAANYCGAKHRPVVIAQLTHSGRYSKPAGKPEPIIPQHDPYRDAMTPQSQPDKNALPKIPADLPTVTDEYLDQLQNAYVTAAGLAFEVGFDGIDIKSCHGYLANELFACHNRPGKYGGSFENRTRFILEVMDKIRNEFGEDKLITTRMGVYDAVPYPYGWGVDKDDYTKPDLSEPKKLLALMEQRGVKLANITIANPYYNPHCNRPFNKPVVGGYEEPEHPLVGVARLINITAELQRQFSNIALVGTGYSWLRTLMANVAAADKALGRAALIGVGRMAFAYPDFARDIIQKGELDPKKVCVSCSACTQIMKDGGMTGCPVRDKQVYGPIYRQGRV